MKRFALFLSLTIYLLAGCMPLTAVPVPDSGADSPASQPTPVVEETLPSTSTPAPSPTAQPTPEPTATQPAPMVVAYVGRDGNIWLVDAIDGQQTQITSDAAGYSEDMSTTMVSYDAPAWSSDGQYLAFTRQEGVPAGDGYTFTHDLQVYSPASGELLSVFSGRQTAGFAWKPGTHILAYALATDLGYFTTRGSVDSSLATGIWTLDVDTRATSELVKPESGYTLFRPAWSPNGEIISFWEVVYMEGQGPSAYYDLAAQAYHSFEKPLGSIAWSSDGSQFLHDNMVYVPSYTERIFLAERDLSRETQLSPDIADSYSYAPLFSPSGEQIVYLTVTGMDAEAQTAVMVQDFPAGQPRELGKFTQIYFLSWAPNGNGLILSTGDYPHYQVAYLSLQDGSLRILADGWQATMQP